MSKYLDDLKKLGIDFANIFKKNEEQPIYELKTDRNTHEVTDITFKLSNLKTSLDALKDKLTKFSKMHKTACITSIIAIPLITLVISKILFALGIVIALSITAGLIYLNNRKVTLLEQGQEVFKDATSKVTSGIGNLFKPKEK